VAIDYAQNSIGRNTAAPYTVRALPGAPVSTPLTWEEVAAGQVRPGDLSLRTVPARVRELGDLFSPVLGRDQRLPALRDA
jgi:bifunctional non-homologous end joining protein LigD